jgi:hypothetical protein
VSPESHATIGHSFVDLPQYANLLGLGHDMKSKARVTIPAYAGSLSLLNAKARP